jgi:F420-dependent oxidoreductase-like protein
MAAPLFGYHMPNFTFADVARPKLFGRVIEMTQAAETAGFDLVTVMDHFYQIRGVGPETEPMLEAYSTLAALATHTSRVRLGTLVTGVTYRNPALLAKTVTTLDIISGGRAVLGIGAAWNESEHNGYGFAFPVVRERMDRLDEALTIARLMFTEQRPSFEGKFYRIVSALNEPRPLQDGGPTIMVGGGGEQRTLRLAARHAAMTHWFVGSLDEFKHKVEVLERHCAAEKRDPGTIVKLVGAPVDLALDESHASALAQRGSARPGTTPATPQRAAEIMAEYVQGGVQGFVFRNPNLNTPELLQAAGRVKQLLSS